jgi:membrane-associated phospholipid phosphatase
MSGSVPSHASARRRRIVLSWGGLAAYLGLSAVVFARWDLLTSQDWVWIWLLVGLLLVSLADLRGWLRGVLRDWLPFMGMILAYNLLRGISDGLVQTAHSRLQIDFDRAAFAGRLPTVALQRKFFGPPGHLHWYDYATWAVYSTHFVVTVGVAAVLWRVNRPRFRQFRTRVVALAFAAIATFALYPTLPPWLAGEHHLIPSVRRVALHVAHDLGVHQIGAVFAKGSHFANVVAAVPSLHAAYPMLLLLFFWSSRPAIRILLSVYVLAMGLAVVYSGEHYVFDVLAGWVYAAATVAAVGAAARLRVRWGDARLAAVPRPVEDEIHGTTR